MTVTGAIRLRTAIDDATGQLASAGVDSARVDAELLAAHALGVPRSKLIVLADIGDEALADFRDLVDKRAKRIPLQHLTETAAFGPLLLHVGPGVFIPRPETESLLEWAMAQPLSGDAVIVDLCTGSGALALALAAHRPSARVIGVDDSAQALRYAARNAQGTHVELVEADVTATDLLAELAGTVDLVVANPPYIPDGAVLEPEVAEHDPHHALFGGPDGMDVVASVVRHASRLLRPGGLFAVEHDDTTSELTVALVEGDELFVDVTARRDLAGRPRYVTARRKGATS